MLEYNPRYNTTTAILESGLVKPLVKTTLILTTTLLVSLGITYFGIRKYNQGRPSLEETAKEFMVREEMSEKYNRFFYKNYFKDEEDKLEDKSLTF